MSRVKQNLNSYLGMTKRNVLLFFKDKTTLFFSMLAPLIVFFLYVIFLKDTYLSGLKESLNAIEGYYDAKDIESLANLWLLAGILGTASVTVALNSLQVMVRDKNLKIDYDYTSSPISGVIVILSYFTSALLNTFMITGGILTIGLGITSVMGNTYLSIGNVFMLYLLTLLGSASSVIVMMVIVSFFKKTTSLAAFSGIVSAAIGFVIGAYIPLGNFSREIQGVLSLVPGSHVACLYRNLLMNGVLEHINTSLNGIDNGTFYASVHEAFALNLNVFSLEASKGFMMIYTLSSIGLAFILNVVLYRKTIKRS